MKTPHSYPLIGITGMEVALGSEQKILVQGQLVSYLKAITGAGGAPVIIPSDLNEEVLRAAFERLEGLLLPGGPDVSPIIYDETPHEQLGRVDEALDHTELALTRWAIDADLPLLAICRGIQVLNVALGGSLYQDIPSQLPDAMEHHRFRSRGYPPNDQAHTVTVTPDSRLAAALGEVEVIANSRHHQAVKTPAPMLTAVGHSFDDLIEGVEIPNARFAIGVQWHPENLVNENLPMHRLFETFVKATRDSKIPQL